MITFDAQTHSYRDERGRLPSVTTIIAAAGMMDATWFTDYARDRGTAVHQATALADDGKLDVDSLDPVIVPYLEAWLHFLTDSHAELCLIEHRAYNPHFRYAGTLDRTAVINGRPTVIDIKTGTRQPWHGVQLAAYNACLTTNHDRMTVMLHDDGKYSTETHRDRNDWGLFLSALSLYNWRHQHNLIRRAS